MGLEFRTFFLTTAVVFACGRSHAQNLTRSVAEAYQPRFTDGEFVLDTDLPSNISFGLGARATYDSNIEQDEGTRKSDLIFSITPSVIYHSDPRGGSRYSLEANYSPVYKIYQDRSEPNSLDQASGAVLRYTGAKATLTTYANYREMSGGDDFAQGYVQGAHYSFRTQGTYQLAPRTSLRADVGTSFSTYSTGQKGAKTYYGGITGNWAYSNQLSFGPSFRYSRIQSDLTGVRESYSSLLQSSYKLDEKISLVAAAGLQISRDSRLDSKGSTAGLTGDLTAHYRLGQRWNWSNTVRYATLPSPSYQNYIIQDLTVTSSLSRELNKGSVSFGVDWSKSNYEPVGPVVESRPDSTRTSFLISYDRPIFNDRASFNSSAHYSVSKGSRDYSKFQLSMGVYMKF